MGTFQSVWEKISEGITGLFRDYELRLGEVLVKKGCINKDDLECALQIQQDRYLRYRISDQLGYLIVGLGFATEDEVLVTIREYYRIPVDSLSDDIAALVEAKRNRD